MSYFLVLLLFYLLRHSLTVPADAYRKMLPVVSPHKR